MSSITLLLLLTFCKNISGQTTGIIWNGQLIVNNSLVALSVVSPRVNATSGLQYPLVCQGITGGQWYQPNGTLFPLATQDPVSTPGGLGQRNWTTGVELYRGSPSVFPHGVQCCTSSTITLCVGMYSDLTLAAAVSLNASNPINYALSVAVTYGPNITGNISFQLLTPTNVDPPVFQLACTSTSSPPTTVQWTFNGSPVNSIVSQTVIDGPTSTYYNTLTVAERSPGMYTCTVTTTCSPLCGATGFTLNPRSASSSLTVQGPPDPPTGVTAVQSGSSSVTISWTAPSSGGPVTRYDIYYVAGEVSSKNGGSTTSTSYVLKNLQIGFEYNIFVIAVGTHLASTTVSTFTAIVPTLAGLQAINNTFTTITLAWQAPSFSYQMAITSIMFQVTINGIVNNYNSTSSPLKITGLLPRTTYSFSVIPFTYTFPGITQQINATTADIPNVTGLGVSAINQTSVRVSWLAVQLPPDGILVGYTVYHCSFSNSLKRPTDVCDSETFPPTINAGDINTLNPNDAYQFSVVAQVNVTGWLYNTSMSVKFSHLTASGCHGTLLYYGWVLAGALVSELVVLCVIMAIAITVTIYCKKQTRSTSTRNNSHCDKSDAINMCSFAAKNKTETGQEYYETVK